jgi:hypothetical protein
MGRTANIVISEAAENISKMSKGTTVTHLVMAQMLETKWKTPQYGVRVSQLRKRLRDVNGVFLVTEHKVGYRIANEGEEIEVCDSKCLKGIKFYRNGVKDMNQIRIDSISDPAKRNKTIQVAQNRANLLGLLKLGNSDNTNKIAE